MKYFGILDILSPALLFIVMPAKAGVQYPF